MPVLLLPPQLTMAAQYKGMSWPRVYKTNAGDLVYFISQTRDTFTLTSIFFFSKGKGKSPSAFTRKKT